jgi:glycolate oxidase FAD binding subunit
LGVLAQVSLRVLPAPRVVRSLAWQLAPDAARARMLALPRAPWPISGMCYDGSVLRVRLAGSEEAVSHACGALAPDGIEAGLDFWSGLRDLSLPFFGEDPRPLWRLSLPPAAPDPLNVGALLHDWGGAQRWLHADDGTALRAHCQAHGGHASRFRGGVDDAPFAEPPSALRALMQRLKDALDPSDVLNPGRMYAWL